MSRKFSQKSQKTKIIKAKLKKMITLVVDFHSSTTYLQSQSFLALVTTLKYFFQSVRKILSGPCISSLITRQPVNQWVLVETAVLDYSEVFNANFHYIKTLEKHFLIPQNYKSLLNCTRNYFIIWEYWKSMAQIKVLICFVFGFFVCILFCFVFFASFGLYTYIQS